MSSDITPNNQEPLPNKSKGLLALVIFLGVLIIIATTILIGTIISRITHRNTSTNPTVYAPIPVTQLVSVLQEPKDTQIVQIMRQSDNLLVISLKGGGTDRLVVWDIIQQKKISEIQLSN